MVDQTQQSEQTNPAEMGHLDQQAYQLALRVTRLRHDEDPDVTMETSANGQKQRRRHGSELNGMGDKLGKAYVNKHH
eukprot:5838328-Pyramimonas_sp.AAC.1